MLDTSSESGLVGQSIRRPVGVVMTAAAVVMMGWVCLRKLPTNLMPEVAYPSLTVRTELEGSAPEEVEKLLSEPIEQRLGVLNNLVSIKSISRAGVSDVQLEFRWGTRMDQLVSEVREKLDQVGRPEGAERPLILRYDPTLDPMMTIGVSPPLPAVEVRLAAGKGKTKADVGALARRLLSEGAWASQVEGRRVRERAGRYELRLSLGREADLEAARAAVEAALEQAERSKVIEEPEVLAVPTPETDLASLRRIAIDELQRRLEPIEGVAAAEVQGGRVREIRVALREDALSVRNLTVSQVVARIRAENLNMAGGVVKDGESQSLLRAMAEYEDLDQIRDTVVAVVDDTPVRLRELGEVTLGYRKQDVITRAGGRQAVQIAVYKEATANIVGVADAVRRALEGSRSFTGRVPGLTDELAERVHVEVLSDSSRFIRLATGEVYSTALIGGALAMLVLYLFLGSLLHTAIISLAIPLSVVAAFVPMQLFGVSLNVMSLGGLALGIGMLVDNSIVVLESIHRAAEEVAREEGGSPGMSAARAAFVGTSRVAGAVTASTLTTVAVFFPIAFVEGIAGQIFRDQALTVVASLLASLVVSLMFIPMLAALQMPAREERYQVRGDWVTWRSAARLVADLRATWPRWYLWPIAWPWTLAIFVVAFTLELIGKVLALFALVGYWAGLGALWLLIAGVTALLWLPRKAVEMAMAAVERGYAPVLRQALLRPLPLLVIVGAAAYGSWQLAGTLGSELIPEVHQGELLLNVELPVGTPLDETDRVVAGIERRLRAIAEVEGIDARCGVEKSATSDPGAGEHTALLRMRLSPRAASPEGEARVIEQTSAICRSVPELRFHIDRPTLLSLSNPLSVEIKADDLDVLQQQTGEVTSLLRGQTGLADVRPSLKPGNPEFHLHYDRERLAKFDLDIRRVAEVVRDKVHGVEATRVRWDGERIDLWVGLRDEDVSDRAALGRIRVDGGGEAIAKRLGEVASIGRERGPSEIRHIGQQRAAVVEARVTGIDLGRTASLLQDELYAMETASDGAAQLTVAGQSAEMRASLSSLQFALALALFLVYVVMASQFESFVQPLVIMLTVPLAAVGVVAALYLAGLPISVLVLIGGIVLAGIVVNNAIVLVDAINQELAAALDGRRRGPREAVVEAICVGSATRLRPVLMTTLTTVLGLVPLTGSVFGLFSLTTGAELRRPLAITIIAGLVSATLLTLLVIPAFYGWIALWRSVARDGDDAEEAGEDAGEGPAAGEDAAEGPDAAGDVGVSAEPIRP